MVSVTTNLSLHGRGGEEEGAEKGRKDRNGRKGQKRERKEKKEGGKAWTEGRKSLNRMLREWCVHKGAKRPVECGGDDDVLMCASSHQ
jgi:hypothetical protein